MALVSLEDPGLTVFGYHRLLSNLGDTAAAAGAARRAAASHFDVEEVPLEQLDPAGEEGIGVFGYVDAHHRKGFRLRLKDPAALEARDPRRLAGLPRARRRDPRVAAAARRARDERRGHRGEARDRLHRLGRARRSPSLDEGTDAAFLMRPTPVEQVRAVAAAGETMPPKSTYFFPKLLTGIVFNPLS